ncbi:gated mechanosensitive channel [Neocallimastix lanati (nom. inval.)]|jgi:large conductance mechanosensitive channel|uniref:Gated mechanosensitive channel n=1 Tax=Neocallimastix californiae TaxID=1754190 RepID=A0A1Y2CUH3_9FUNG|nr:gated mechanosensitive channel [Neocallimastix sp. JGI-2020a]ORY50673.1 gated mechanosensitive channel [Neocallimastix californiae]|eukprot:ORY50673.1 gated mechanosensitive channel [Neocallimastix californiae]
MTSSETLNKDGGVVLSVGKGATKVASKGVGFFKDFIKFLNKGNVIDLATGVVIGTAFTNIVNSIVNDFFSPIIGLITRGKTLTEKFWVVDHGNATDGTKFRTREEAAKYGAVTINFGNFLQTLINFVIVGFCVFLVIKLVSAVWKKEEEISTDWPCPRCKQLNKLGATKCYACGEDPIYPEDVDPELYLKDPEAALKKDN